MSPTSASERNLPDPAPGNHGRTLAGWVTNTGIVIGAAVAAVAIAIAEWWLAGVGAGIALLALIIGGALKAAGRGQPSRRGARESRGPSR